MTGRDWSDALSQPPKPTKTSRPLAEWFVSLGLTGKLMLFGAVLGLAAAFLPLVHGEPTVRIVEEPRGVIGVLCYLVAGALAVLLYLPDGYPQQTKMARAAACAGVVGLVMAAWLANDGRKTGTYAVAINLAAALAVTAASLRIWIREELVRRSVKRKAARGKRH